MFSLANEVSASCCFPWQWVLLSSGCPIWSQFPPCTSLPVSTQAQKSPIDVSLLHGNQLFNHLFPSSSPYQYSAFSSYQLPVLLCVLTDIHYLKCKWFSLNFYLILKFVVSVSELEQPVFPCMLADLIKGNTFTLPMELTWQFPLHCSPYTTFFFHLEGKPFRTRDLCYFMFLHCLAQLASFIVRYVSH